MIRVYQHKKTMINKNDLYDITYALIIIRNHIREETNTLILLQMINILETQNNTEDNQIRKGLATIKGIDRERWFFVYHNNVYVNCQILKKSDIYNLLLKLLRYLIHALEKEEFDKAYDLVDCFHCLPEIIADNNFSIPKTFWKTFVKYYRDKWDNDFLKVEQKEFKKYL